MRFGIMAMQMGTLVILPLQQNPLKVAASS